MSTFTERPAPLPDTPSLFQPLPPPPSIPPAPSAVPSLPPRSNPPSNLQSSGPAAAADHPGLLGEWASRNAVYLAKYGWYRLARSRRGRSEISPSVGLMPHDAAGYLDFLRRIGAPVVSHAPPKTPAELQAAVDRGPHPSATAYADFLWGEAYEMCQRRHAMILPFSAVKNITGVEISPPGVVPQRDRRPRTICDLTFSGVNANTAPLTHDDAMQFGNTLLRILFRIYRADPRWGPVYLAKVDISDGFYNITVNPNGVKHFGIILPTPPGQEPLVLFFLGLPMGWVSSPPVFCAATESVADVANARIASNWHPPPHRQDAVADTPTPWDDRPPAVPGRPPRIKHRNQGPLGTTDCYVDDFILACQGGKRRRRRLRRILFHCIDMVFREPDSDDDSWKKDPISLKKLLKGDGSLETTKVILGWLVDTVAGTIELPPHRVQRLRDMLAAFPRSRKTCSKKDLHKLVGELRSMIIAIPGGLGCLSWLQERLRSAPDRIYLNSQFKDAIDDFRWLADDISNRPTRIAEIIPEAPAFVGTTDASGRGMGGVWLPDAHNVWSASLSESTLKPVLSNQRGSATASALQSDRHDSPMSHPPLLWRALFPPEIADALVSWTNPDGSISISDLELAGVLAGNDILAQAVDVTEVTTGTGTDNLAALSWSTKKAVSVTGPASYLLRLMSLHQRAFRYQLRSFYMPGPANSMADDCSRLWHLSDDELLAHFNLHYPQKEPWQICHLRPEMFSALISALSCVRQPPQAILGEASPARTSGTSGLHSALPSGWMIPASQASSTSSPSSCALPSSTEMGDWHLKVPPSSHGQRKMLFDSLAKRSPNWASRTRGLTVTDAWTYA